MPVSELGIADVGEAVGLLVVPPVPELRLPHEGQRALDLVGDELADDVSRVDVDGADGHDLLAVALGQGPEQQGDLEKGSCFLRSYNYVFLKFFIQYRGASAPYRH